MPRLSTLESPGCPPLRALTTDSLGLIKVVEVRGKGGGTPQVVEMWGPPDASRSVLCTSFADRKKDPLLIPISSIFQWQIEFFNPLEGDVLATIKASESRNTDQSSSANDPLIGLHFFKSKHEDLSSMLGTLLTCTEKGKVCVRSIAKSDAPSNQIVDSPSEWSVTNGGQVLCSSLDPSENYALFGGKHVELNLWDLNTSIKTWTAKSPRPNNLGICIPTWFTASTFLCKDDHRKIVAGTSQHQVRLYDITSQRRAVISIDFRESPIKAVREDTDGHTVYVGTAIGDLASFDIRTGKMVGCYKGKCSGSIRSIAKHPQLPLIASCGLDSYLRIWDTNKRQLLSAVFLKQHLTSVVIDSHFTAQELEGTKLKGPASQSEASNQPDEDGSKDEDRSRKSKKKRKEVADKKKKKSKMQDEEQISGVDEPEEKDWIDELPVSKRRKHSKKRREKQLE
ncbi:WD repeat-containing protein [Carex littledalei]|uniref:WD repeat-containing protein n=1 Tax=Carex littledalei TaxID=544730 RepID=A0A833QKE0_9POAL|nr:WD repeat-containing protein [Carex littledalei]